MANNVMDDLLKDNSAVVFKAGKIAKGVIFKVLPSCILVELDGGLTGIITKKESSGYGVNNDDFDEGMNIESLVIDPENEQGLVALSLRRANQEIAWTELQNSMNEGSIIKVKITEANKGGLMALYKGVKAFLPVSQLSPSNYPRVDGAESGEILRRLQSHIGLDFAVKVINVDRNTGKLIVSEKATLEEQKNKILKNIQNGDIMQGTVSGVVKFGIFVTFDGVEGLVHLSELDWGHVADPGKKYAIGDKIEVLVLGVERDKLALSVKRLSDDPWKELVKDFSVGDKVTGQISRWNASGVFIDVLSEVPGLFSLTDFEVEDHADLKLKDGEELKGEITEINYESHRLMLKKV